MPRRLIRPLLALGFGLFGLAAVSPVYNTYVAILLHNAGLSASLVAFVMTWDNWLNIVIPWWAGRESDRRWTRIGRRKPWILVGAILALTFVLIPLAGTLPAMLLALFFTSLGLAIARAPGLALLGDLFPARSRSVASGVINVFGGLGAVLALFGSGFLFDVGPALPFFFAGALLFIGSAVLLWGVQERRESHADAVLPDDGFWMQLRALVQGNRSGWLLLLAIFFSFSGFNAAETWLSSYAHFSLGATEAQLPLFMAIFAGALLLAAIPSGMLASRWGRKRMAIAGMVALAALLAAGLFVRSPLALALLLAPAGAAWAPILVNTLPLLYDVGGGQKMGALTGLYYVSASLAAVLGPQVVGWAVDASGGSYQAVWAIAAVFMAVGAVVLAQVQVETE
ncbi:MAG TPA: SLC45 family MFS transporter [Caldilineae bacterium]|nr:SLC45 family MFS transporter [Caldilineae bacterium]